MRTSSALKRRAKHSERYDHERRNYPPAPLRRINAAIQTPAKSNVPSAASAISPALHVRKGNETEMRRSISRPVEV
jgi:hypothetical protein